MKPLPMRLWLLLSWILCLVIPRLGWEVVEATQRHFAFDMTGTAWRIWPLVSALLAMGGTLLIVGWLIGRTILQPLAAVQQAARQVALGNLTFDIGSSHVREINEVATAITVMRDALEAAVAHEAAIDQERRHFIGAIAHDLRTPLFALRGYLSGVISGVAKTVEQVDRYLTIAQAQADTLDQRINALVDFVRFDYTEQPFVPVELAWPQVVQQAVERITPVAQGKAVHLHLVPANPPSTLLGDEQLLLRLLENLLDNAVRHSPTGATVTLTWCTKNEQLHFTVTDEGPGIPPADLPHIFEPLFRSEASRSRSTGGMGLGLTIAQRIVQRHGGTLTAANCDRGGARFTAILPIGSA